MACGAELAVHLGDFAHRTECDQVLGIELQCGREDSACFRGLPCFVEGLAEDDVAADVAGLASEVRAADGDRLGRVAGLAQFVGERREVAAWILLELDPEFFESRVHHANAPCNATLSGSRLRSHEGPST